MNVAQHDLLRLTAPDAGHHLGGHLDMEAFDPDMNFEPEGLLCVFLPFYSAEPALASAGEKACAQTDLLPSLQRPPHEQPPLYSFHTLLRDLRCLLHHL